MAGQRNSGLFALLLVASIATGSVGARELQQQDTGNTLGNLVTQVTNAAGQVASQVIAPLVNATQQAANATGANSSITAPLANLTQTFTQGLTNLTRNTSLNPLNISSSPAPGNNTDLGQTIGQGLGAVSQWVGNVTGNLSQFASNVTSAVGNGSRGIATNTQQQQNLTPPWQNGAGGRTVAGTITACVAGAIVLSQLVL